MNIEDVEHQRSHSIMTTSITMMSLRQMKTLSAWNSTVKGVKVIAEGEEIRNVKRLYGRKSIIKRSLDKS